MYSVKFVKVRKYNIFHVHDKNGRETQMTAYPMTHAECMTMLSKQSDASRTKGRFVLREV